MRCEGFRECDRPIEGTCHSCQRPLCQRHVVGTSCGRTGIKKHHMEAKMEKMFSVMTCQSCGAQFEGGVASKRCRGCNSVHMDNRNARVEIEHHRAKTPVKGGWK